jgi:DNA invertase Pin-like site-specific DNA recombinase
VSTAAAEKQQHVRITNAKTTAKSRVAIYLRISSDRAGDELGVKRQLSRCRSLIAAKGWTEVAIYQDNDTSAAGKQKRPAYDAMFDDVRSGRVTVIVAWSFDRLTRSMRQLEDIIELHEKTGVNIATVDGELDLSTETGRMVARILAAVARAELEFRRKRQLSEREQKAKMGHVNGGGSHRPFGFEDDRVTHHAVEAELIREAAKRVLAGETLSSIVRDFAARGVKSPSGHPLTQQRLRLVLISARTSGRRSHWQAVEGEQRPLLPPIVGKAAWKPIVKVADSDRLRTLLTATSRRLNTNSTARVHLLPGFLHCSTCKRRMVSSHAGGYARYSCEQVPGAEKCKKIITAKHVDELVTTQVLAMIDTPKYQRLLHKRTGVSAKLVQSLQRDEQRLLELVRERESGLLELDEWRESRDVVKQRRDETKALIESAVRDDAMRALLTGEGSIEARWEAMTLSQQRAVIDSAVQTILVSPAANGGRVFNPERVEVVWRA